MIDQNKSNSLSIVAMILSIIGLVLSCVVVGILPSIAGLLFSIVALLTQSNRKNMAIASLITSSIGLAIAIFIILTSFVLKNIDNLSNNEMDKENVSDALNKPTTEPSDLNQLKEKLEIDKNNINIGDVFEDKDAKIKFISATKYTDYEDYFSPKNGYIYYRAEFEFENIGDDDFFASSFDFSGYADGYAIDKAYIADDNLNASLSPGKKAKGSIYLEVPQESEEIILEYETNYWTEEKIVFIVK